MNNKIFPASIVNDTVEVYDARISVKSRIIYLLVLGFLLSFLVALPFIYVDVSVQSPGTFQSALQRNPILSSVSGRIEKWNLSENQKVHKGEVLAVIRGEMINLEVEGLAQRLSLLNGFIDDLNNLLGIDWTSPETSLIKLKTTNYQASLLEFQSTVTNQLAAVHKLERDFERAKLLYESKSIAFADFDNIEVQFKQATAELDLIKKQKVNGWEQELINHTSERLKLQNQMRVYSEELDQYQIIAGTNGSLSNVVNLHQGDFVYPQQQLAELSPDTTLLAFTYISPADIAFIRKDQAVNFQVDAYNYNQWGIATGKVLSVSDDLVLLNEKEAGFLVTCILDQETLRLTTGQEGTIGKGMSFNARFVVARRSVFQLLYDKVDNWLNPFVKTQN